MFRRYSRRAPDALGPYSRRVPIGQRRGTGGTRPYGAAALRPYAGRLLTVRHHPLGRSLPPLGCSLPPIGRRTPLLGRTTPLQLPVRGAQDFRARLHRPGASGPGPGVRPPRQQSSEAESRRSPPSAGTLREPGFGASPPPGAEVRLDFRPAAVLATGSAAGERRRGTPTGHPGPEPRGDPNARLCHRAPLRRRPGDGRPRTSEAQ